MKQLRIGIDIRDLRISKSGAKTYLEEIYKEFSNSDYNCIFYFFDTFVPVYTGSNVLLKLTEHIRFIAWKQVMLPLKAWFNGCDVLFCTDYFVPVFHPGFKTVPVFHDAFYWEYPEHYNSLWLKMFKLLGVTAARTADKIVTVSEYAKQQLIKYSNLPADKIEVIHLAPKNLQIGNLGQNINVSLPSKYILHVGTLEKRKNLLKLIESFYLLQQEGYIEYNLVLIGQPSSKTNMDDSQNIHEAILKFNLTHKVYTYGYLTDEELYHAYQNASMYVFPSINEGFGIPVLEAFQHQLPVLIADNTCLPEIAGAAALTFNPYNAFNIMEKMKLVIDDNNLQTDLIKKGNERLKHFSWPNTAATLVELFKKLNELQL